MALAPRASSRCSRSRRYPAARPWASRRRTSIPHATFAAYRTHDGLAIARAEGGAAGTVDAAGWSGLAPAYRVEVGGQVIGELRVPSTAQLEIRAPERAPCRARSYRWDDGASPSGRRLGTR